MGDIAALLNDLFGLTVSETGIKIVAAIIAAIFGPVIFYYLRKIWRWLTTCRRNSKKLKRALDAVESQEGLWLAIPVKRADRITNDAPNGYDVTTIANLKGGVGKTTLAANLIGHCAVQRTHPGDSVLGIDFDYQGSLTSMALPNFTKHSADDKDSRAGQLIFGDLDAA